MQEATHQLETQKIAKTRFMGTVQRGIGRINKQALPISQTCLSLLISAIAVAAVASATVAVARRCVHLGLITLSHA